MPADRIILVRHGRTASNAAGVWQGYLNTPLDEVGIAEAHNTALALGPVERPSRIVSSDLSRAMATAQPMADHWRLPLQTEEKLREVNAGAWEGLGRKEIAERWPEDFAGWQRGDDVAIGGAERMSEAGERVAAAIEALAADTDGTLVIVSHGGCLRMAALRLTGLPMNGRALRTMRNAHWGLLVRGQSGTLSLDSWNLGPVVSSAPPAMP